jgi:thiol-disulfide isomerase/thioredoxin
MKAPHFLILIFVCISLVTAEGYAQQAPPFVLPSLDDSTSYIANESFEGNVYLVDFWATWCPPCVEALPGMEEMYEEYHSRGFEILSLSFDASNERIRHFREKHYAMPWRHGRLAGGFNDVVSLSFQLQNIPHYVLVGRDGNILAQGDDVHGDRLRTLLKEHL